MKALPVVIALLLSPRLVFAVTEEEARAQLQPKFAERKLAAPFDVDLGKDGDAPAATITFRPSPEEAKAYREKADLLVPLVIAGHCLPALVPGLGRICVQTAEGASVRADAATIGKFVAKALDREAFERAVTFRASAATAAKSDFGKGLKLWNADQYAAAIPLLRNAVQADRANANAWMMLIHALVAEARCQEAIEAFDAVMSATPDFRFCAVVSRAYVRTGNMQMAGNMLSRFEEGRKQDPSRIKSDSVSRIALHLATKTYIDLKQPQKAQATAEIYAQHGGSRFGYEQLRAWIFEASQQWEQAMGAWQKALELAVKEGESTVPLYGSMAYLHIQLKEWNAAVRAYRRAYSQGERGKELFVNLAYCYWNLERFFDARHVVQEGLKVHPEDKALQTNYKAIQKVILTRKLKPEGEPTPLALDN